MRTCAGFLQLAVKEKLKSLSFRASSSLNYSENVTEASSTSDAGFSNFLRSEAKAQSTPVLTSVKSVLSTPYLITKHVYVSALEASRCSVCLYPWNERVKTGQQLHIQNSSSGKSTNQLWLCVSNKHRCYKHRVRLSSSGCGPPTEHGPIATALSEMSGWIQVSDFTFTLARSSIKPSRISVALVPTLFLPRAVQLVIISGDDDDSVSEISSK